MSTVEVDNQIVIDARAREKWNECQTQIEEAKIWADGDDIPWEQVGEHGEEIVLMRRELVANMERSFHRSFMSLVMVSQHHDGPLKIFADAAPCSFFWRHEKSGYHGGLIYHRHYTKDGREPLPVGTWSIHT